MSAEPPPFSVRVGSAADRARFWFWDPSHFPQPVTPAAETFDLPAMASGFAAAATELRRPLAGQYVRVERGYVYFGVDVPPSPEELTAREARYRKTVGPRIGTALADWTDRYAPEARRLTVDLDRLAGDARDDTRFAELLDRAVTLRSQQWRIHDLALVPAMEAAARFTDRYAERLGGAVAAQTLLQGFPNRATAASEAIESLVESVRARPAIVGRLLGGEPLSLDMETVTADEGWFAAALREFLSQFGRRAEAWDVGAPTWAEDPAPVLSLLADHLRRPAGEPGARRRRAATAREEATARVVSQLPPEERGPFLESLRAAQAYVVVSEDHNALIDQQGMAALRGVLLAAGARLVASGVLARPDDAVWLTKPELGVALHGGPVAPTIVSRRRARHRRRTHLTPPRTFGSPLPVWASDNSTLAGFFGLGGEPASTGNSIDGTGVSSGVAEGRACVVRSLDEIEALAPGDILVCPMTSPAWTPWLGLIAGAVVETGGMLSHTAILAREYGIPCVTNARCATQLIPQGAIVRVDGSQGQVNWR